MKLPDDDIDMRGGVDLPRNELHLHERVVQSLANPRITEGASVEARLGKLDSHGWTSKLQGAINGSVIIPLCCQDEVVINFGLENRIFQLERHTNKITTEHSTIRHKECAIMTIMVIVEGRGQIICMSSANFLKAVPFSFSAVEYRSPIESEVTDPTAAFASRQKKSK